MKNLSNLKQRKITFFSAIFIVAICAAVFSCKKQEQSPLTMQSLAAEYGLTPAPATAKPTKSFNSLAEVKAYLESKRQPFSFKSKRAIVSKVTSTSLMTNKITSMKVNSIPTIGAPLRLDTEEAGGGSVGGCHAANYYFNDSFTVSTPGYDDDMYVTVSYNTSGGAFTWTGTSVMFINHTGTIGSNYASTSGGDINGSYVGQCTETITVSGASWSQTDTWKVTYSLNTCTHTYTYTATKL